MSRFTLTMTRHDGRTLTEELDHRMQVRDLVATVLSVLTFRPEHEFLDFATEVSVTDDGRTVAHPEVDVMFELTMNRRIQL